MQAYDVLMLVVLALAIAWGAWKGLVWQIASIASIVLSYFVALRFRQPLAGIIEAAPPWNMFLAMLILFLATGLVVWLGFNLVSEFIERVRLKEFDRQLGALFGAAKGALLCILVTLFSVALLGDAQRQAICNSKSGYYIAVLLDRADLVIPRELHSVLEPYLDRLDKTIPHPHTAGPGMPDYISERVAAARKLTPLQNPPTAWQPKVQGEWQAAPPASAPTMTLPGSFPTTAAQQPAGTPQTVRRIEAAPAPNRSLIR
jgi:membrane protein required for colicin V production